MKVRELKEWIDKKSDDELEMDVIVSDRLYPCQDKDKYDIMMAGTYISDGKSVYLLRVEDHEKIKLREEKNALNEQLHIGETTKKE